MAETPPHCLICGDLLIRIEAALNRNAVNVMFTGYGSSELQIRLKGQSWMPFMIPDHATEGLYCTRCGALTLAPSLPAHRRELGLD